MGDHKCSCGKAKDIKYKGCAACFAKKSHNGHDKFKNKKHDNATEISEMTSSMIHTSQLLNVLFMYTDGSCIGNSNVANRVCPAGWGVVITKPDLILGDKMVDVLSLEKSTDQCILVDELYGPVVLESSSPYYLHATVASNNTSELSAIGEALMWLLHNNPTNIEPHRPKQTAFIRYDSEYAAKSVQRIFNGTKNVELIAHIRTIYDAVCLHYEVVFLHVKGHSGHMYNDRADVLANQGNKGVFCSSGRFAPNAVTYTCSSTNTASGSNNSSSSGGRGSAVIPSSFTSRTSHTTAPRPHQNNNNKHSMGNVVVVQIPVGTSSGVSMLRPSTDSFADRVQPKPRPVLSLTSSSTKSSTIRPSYALFNPAAVTAAGARSTVNSNTTLLNNISNIHNNSSSSGGGGGLAKRVFAPNVNTASKVANTTSHRQDSNTPYNTFITSNNTSHKTNAIDLTVTRNAPVKSTDLVSTPSIVTSSAVLVNKNDRGSDNANSVNNNSHSIGVKKRVIVEFSSSDGEDDEEEKKSHKKVSRLT